jgi:hypothetical protein
VAAKINYMSELNAFYKRQQTDNLKPMSKLLWYTLMAVNNTRSWAEWFECTNGRLCIEMGINSNSLRTLYTARKELLGKGYIEYEDRKGERKPGRYKMIRLSHVKNEEEQKERKQEDKTAAPTTVETTGETGTETTSYLHDINKQEETKQKDEGKNDTDAGQKQEQEPEKVIETAKVDLKEVLDCYLELAQKDLEGASDINTAKFIIAQPGMTMSAVRKGIERSAKAYKPKYPMQRMPLFYCKPAIFRELDIEKQKGGNAGDGRAKRDSKAPTEKAKRKKQGNADSRTKRLLANKEKQPP